MAVNYQEQYRPDQLEPFWPNEIARMVVVVLCTLAVIMLLAILPSVLEATGIRQIEHEAPADPRGATPTGIKPEWYFLATYQYLRLMPTTLFGMSGKTLGVLSSGVGVLVVVLVPFLYRRNATRRPGWAYRLVITFALATFLVLTFWGEWPEKEIGGEIREVPLWQYVQMRSLMFIVTGVSIVVFYALLAHERREIRRVLDGPPPQEPPKEEPPT